MQEIQENSQLEALLTSGKPVLIDFTAIWCGPCKVAYPAVVQLSRKLPNVTFVKVDVDRAENIILQNFGVGPIPHFHLVAGGKPIRKWLGWDQRKTAGEIEQECQKYL